MSLKFVLKRIVAPAVGFQAAASLPRSPSARQFFLSGGCSTGHLILAADHAPQPGAFLARPHSSDNKAAVGDADHTPPSSTTKPQEDETLKKVRATTSERPRIARIALMVAGVLGAAGNAGAFSIDTENPDVKMRLDTQVRYNLGVRVEDQEADFINSANFDESDLKFDQGDVLTNRLDLFSEFDFVYKKRYGFRVSGAAWYDHAYSDTDVKTNPALAAMGYQSSYDNDEYSSFTERWYRGPSGEILDAFVFGNFDLGPVPVNVKVGAHSNYWGESVFNASHGIAYSQQPIDARKALSSPGIEAKETFLPVNQISTQISLLPNLDLSAVYFLSWKENRLPEGGTYFGAADFFFDGPDRFPLAPQFSIPRLNPVEPEDENGDWGVNLRWSPEWLDGTVGVYYREFTERQPWTAPQVLGFVAGNRFVPTGYRLVYPEDTKLYGISLQKNIGGVTVGAEVSYRENTAFINTSFDANNEGPRGNSWHALINGTYGTRPLTRLLGDDIIILGELVYSRWDDVTKNKNLFKAVGMPGCAGPTGGAGDKFDGCATREYYAMNLLLRPRWSQVIPGGDLTVPISVAYGLSGNAATLSGGNEKSGNWSIGAELDYRAKHSFSLKYQDFFVKYRNRVDPITGLTRVATNNGALYSDRGYVAFTYKYTF